MAAPSIQTTVTELPESRVRVQAEVSSEEIEKRLAKAARDLGRNLKIPGFRPGKIPPPVLINRIGREAVLDEAVRDNLPNWYSQAVDAARIVPVGEPELDLAELPKEGEPLKFTIEIGVRPTAQLGDYKDLEVGRREAEASEEEINAELDRLRDRTAKLETVERPARNEDFVVMDFKGFVDGEAFEGGEARDHMLQLGSGRLIPGFEEQLVGAAAGEDRTVKVTFPEDYGAEHLAGKDAEFAVTVKEVKEKRLPELDDDLAVEAGYDTLDELKEDVRSSIEEFQGREIDNAFRMAALDAAVANATIDVPEALIEARARELWDQMAHSLSHQGIAREMYLQITGKNEEDVIEEGKPDAEQALRREAVLAAVVDAEGIEPADDEILEIIRESTAPDQKEKPEKVLERLRSQGRLDAVKTDIAQRKALDLLVESAKPISVEQAKARGAIWTPDAEEKSASAGRIWTPGS
jgi:trigger factor